MDFTEVIRTRRSVRGYAAGEIPEEVLGRILEAARIAPSGNNRQPWKFVLVKDARLKEKIAEYSYDQGFVGTAPVVAVCCGEKYPNSYLPHRDLAYLIDTIIAVDHLVLAARNEGVGACWVGAFDAGRIAELLGLPPRLQPVMVVPLGYPASRDAFGESYGRKPQREIIHVPDEKSGKYVCPVRK